MAYYPFLSNAEGWTDSDGVWDGSHGRPPGSMYLDGLNLGETAIQVSGISIAASPGDPISFDFRIIIFAPIGDLELDIFLSGPAGAGGVTITSGNNIISGLVPTPYDSGWVTVEGTINNGNEITLARVFADAGATYYDLYFDNIYINEIPLVNELRHLGLAADQGNLYVTRDEDNVLQLWTYDLATLTFIRESTFGAATYAELDARTYGLMPEVKPGAEGVVYLRGRDGNDVKIQVSDESQLIWTSLDDGGWAADKYAVALHPDPLNPADLVAVFSDTEIWRSQDGGASWTHVEDTNVTPREASRHPLYETDLLIAGAGAGANELEYTPNYGLSLEDVSEASMGVVNAIEVSR